jgi:hypothetical protein
VLLRPDGCDARSQLDIPTLLAIQPLTPQFPARIPGTHPAQGGASADPRLGRPKFKCSFR